MINVSQQLSCTAAFTYPVFIHFPFLALIISWSFCTNAQSVPCSRKHRAALARGSRGLQRCGAVQVGWQGALRGARVSIRPAFKSAKPTLLTYRLQE